MKKLYETPDVELVEFQTIDSIMGSGNLGGPSGEGGYDSGDNWED